MSNLKQVIVIRRDLNMRLGKSCAQSAHASVKIVVNCWTNLDKDWNVFEDWIDAGATKICVGANSLDELTDLYDKAELAHLPCSKVTDMGKTEFGGVATITCIAIGPAEAEEIDKITGHLKLL